ncbi:MAG: DNA cytosine methyltransferase [Reyranella sp.]
MIDVFAGAGGLSLGFQWQGWRSLAATDIDKYAVNAFNRNVEPVAFVGNMEEDGVIERLLQASFERDKRRPIALVGGPPCQGFSTGGKRRSEDDLRNQLHSRYVVLLKRLQPNFFVFENVLGLLSLSKGRFLEQVIDRMSEVGYSVAVWRMNAAAYGVPQRRQRLFLVGVPKGRPAPSCPIQWCRGEADDLFSGAPQTTVHDAIGDLPAICAGEDGSAKVYAKNSSGPYQALMRSEITSQQFMVARRGNASQLAA